MIIRGDVAFSEDGALSIGIQVKQVQHGNMITVQPVTHVQGAFGGMDFYGDSPDQTIEIYISMIEEIGKNTGKLVPKKTLDKLRAELNARYVKGPGPKFVQEGVAK